MHVPGITLYFGPMASGKSLRLFDAYQLAKIRRVPVFVAKPSLDTRDDKFMKSRFNGASVKVDLFFSDSYELMDALEDAGISNGAIIIDEAQFGDEDLPKVLDNLAYNFDVYVSALNTSFRGEAFNEVVKDLSVFADKIVSLHAICERCGREATRTQRETNGKPAHYDEPLISIGYDSYFPVCRNHHIVPGKPSLGFKKQGFGWLTVIVGPPSSGKTELLKSYLSKFRGVAEYRPFPPPANELIEAGRRVILIDNYHRASNPREYARILDEMASAGYFIVVAGDNLDKNLKGYSAMREIIPLADYVESLHAYDKIGNRFIPATKIIEKDGVLAPISRERLLKIREGQLQQKK